ncbi:MULTISPECIES: hypothetical protein [unclassified Nocardia]|uniref:hypothetical protein n=1 Tax=unclassified Nocardia TaxID=2637762 RepID=UPI001CE48EBC|nr:MULTISPECIES: hypothetical protein [unclassified Nocardia]
MVLDVVAFASASLLMTVVIAMLAIGLADLPNPPTPAACRRCARGIIDAHHGAEPVCLRCRVIVAFDGIVRRLAHPGHQ